MEHLTFASIIVMIFFVISFKSSNSKELNNPCELYKCSTFPDEVWAISKPTCDSGQKCRIFRNPCLLGRENCFRQSRNETLLDVTTKRCCQPFCETCSCEFQPVCGEYLKKRLTFANKCEMDRYNCKYGKTFLLYSLGRCDCKV